MIETLRKYVTVSRRARQSLVLIFLLFIPYIVDVAYWGDGTPTHFAQEKITEKTEDNRFDDKGPLLSLDDQPCLAQTETVAHQTSSHRQVRKPAVTIALYQRITAFPSRPPPSHS